MPTPKKGYVFTLNNYAEDEFESISRVATDLAQYAIIGREVGANGTPHLQGYILFRRPYRFDTIKSRYLPRCHIEVAAGSTDSNFRYCSKDGDYREFGERPVAVGKGRDEIARGFVKRMESDGRSGADGFAEEHPGVWYFSGHNLLRNYWALKRAISRPEINVKWVHGPPGVGKSRFAHDLYPEAFVKEPRTKWWSGYMLEEEVIIDDFGPGGIDINHLLRWFDRYKCYVESKGGMLPLYASKFVVTSNFSPEECFKTNKYVFNNNVSESVMDSHPQVPALLRRIEVIEMN